MWPQIRYGASGIHPGLWPPWFDQMVTSVGWSDDALAQLDEGVRKALGSALIVRRTGLFCCNSLACIDHGRGSFELFPHRGDPGDSIH